MHGLGPSEAGRRGTTSVPASPGSAQVPRPARRAGHCGGELPAREKTPGKEGKKKNKHQTADTRAGQLSKRPRDWKPRKRARGANRQPCRASGAPSRSQDAAGRSWGRGGGRAGDLLSCKELTPALEVTGAGDSHRICILSRVPLAAAEEDGRTGETCGRAPGARLAGRQQQEAAGRAVLAGLGAASPSRKDLGQRVIIKAPRRMLLIRHEMRRGGTRCLGGLEGRAGLGTRTPSLGGAGGGGTRSRGCRERRAPGGARPRGAGRPPG